MKTSKRIISLIITLIMVVLLVAVPQMPAYAAGNTLTISNAKSHDYLAYQIFAGDYDGSVLSNIEWGDGVDDTSLLTALKASTLVGSSFASASSAEDVAQVLATWSNDSAQMIEFSKLAAAAKVDANKITPSATGDTVSFTGLDTGYYLVIDTTSVAGAEEEAKSRYIVNVPKTTGIEAKIVVPTIEKYIKEDGALVDENTATIGQKVDYVLFSDIPDMTGYNEYYYIVTDTLSAGLSFNNDVKVEVVDDKTIGATAIATFVKDTDPADTTKKDYFVDIAGQTFRIVFQDFIKNQTYNGKFLRITYSATLNEQAVIASTGNPNEVQLKYSNDPTVIYDGDDDDEPDDESMGETPKQDVTTYTYQVKITKVDSVDDTKKLDGAKFKISGVSTDIAMVDGFIFEKDEAGTYYMLKNGSFTLTAPGGVIADDEYDSKTQKYSKRDTIGDIVTESNVNMEGYTDASGIITFEKLGLGTYTIKELEAPEGYNKLTDDIIVKIEKGAGGVGISYSLDGGSNFSDIAPDNGVIAFNVANSTGITLPSTGGIGTTIFYVIGGLLVLGAVVLLITRKRMESEK